MKDPLAFPRRVRLGRIRHASPGQSPGTVVAAAGALKTTIDAIAFDREGLTEEQEITVARALELKATRGLIWMNFEGLADASLIHDVGSALGIHRLTLEDVVHPHQRSKVEYFNDYIYVVVRMVSMTDQLESEQLSIVLGRDFVLTFQEGKPGDSLEPVRQRLRQGKGMLRTAGPDYLAYALLDSVIDHYFPVLERYADKLERLEEQVSGDQYLNVVWQINGIKRELLQLQAMMTPQRDLVQSLIREPNALVTNETRLHLRDVADHTGQIIDLLFSYRETAQALIEIHLNIASARMNEVMQVLTIFGAIFMPLSFIAGVYGMNFDTGQGHNMPELHWKYGYFGALGLMALVAAVLLGFFYRRGWLRGPKEHARTRHDQ